MDGHSGVYFIGLMWSHRKISLVIRYGSSFLEVYADFSSELQQAAESGSIYELYALIDENPYILENIDAVPFVTTPLHVAAASGDIHFAMEMVNLKPSFARKLNTSGYSPLHLAANNDDDGLVQRNKINGDGLTFLDILRNQEQRDAGGDLRSQGPRVVGGEDLDLEQVAIKTGCKEAASLPRPKKRFEILKSPFTFGTLYSTFMRRLRTDTSDEARGVFLIVCTLIITATYQTALQPPGGVHQSEDSNAGSMVMKQTFFILLWVFNTLGFCCAILYTFFLIPLGSLFVYRFFWIGTSLCISYALTMAVISPHPLVFLSAAFAFFLLIALYILLEFLEKRWRTHMTVAPEPRLSWFWKD
ncbi:unnamed protein product [Brassica napus]|uniref:(rape) hypothetical protein n=1 Tax=Brassica napus TaxID=3708 RepID=A0A816SA73_BRANA|nr:unnamed protein product [Brassica napus]